MDHSAAPPSPTTDGSAPDGRRILHPAHGVHEPTEGTPARRPGSIRRTATTDMLRPDGPRGPLILVGRGRDLRTDASGAGSETATAAYRAEIDYLGGHVLRELVTEPRRPGLDGLVGERTASGFRSRIDRADPGLHDEHDLLYLLLDDIPVTALISGQAMVSWLKENTVPPPLSRRPFFPVDLCAGYVAGGTLITEVERSGRPPFVTGPEAPPLTGDDPDAWHALPPLPPDSMRRRRRIDVSADGEVDAFFRDSHVESDGTEYVIHEYTLTARIDTGTGLLASCEARPRVLPWVECPGAVASAGRVAGVPLDGLRRHVRETFTGISTCTHLNDMLRALADVPALHALSGRTA